MNSFGNIQIESQHIVTEGQGTLDPVISIFKDTLATEAYFGKVPMVSFLIASVEKIKKIFEKSIGKTLDNDSRKSIGKHIHEIEDMLARHFNIESVTIEVIDDVSLTSLPVSFGKLDLTPYEAMNTKDAMKEYSAILVDSKGVRYKHKENKQIIMTVGYMLFSNREMKADYLAAAIIHEIGHSFYQYSHDCTIGTQRAFYKISIVHRIVASAISLVHSYRKTFVPHTKFKFTKKMFSLGTDEEVTKFNKKYKHEISKEGRAIGGFIGSFIFIVVGIVGTIRDFAKYVFSDKSALSAEIEKTKDKMLAGTMIIERETDATLVLQTIVWQVFSLISTIVSVVASVPLFLVNNIISIVSVNAVSTRFGEYNADAISAAYGLGVESVEALLLLKKISGEDSYDRGGVSKSVNKIPILREFIQFQFLGISALNAASAGYPSDRERIRHMHDSLVAELRTYHSNPVMNKRINEEIAKIGEIYNEYIDPKVNSEEQKYARSLIYYLTRFFITLKKSNVPLNGATEPKFFELQSAMIHTVKSSKDINKNLNLSIDDEANLLKSLQDMVLEDELVDDLAFNSCGIFPKDVDIEWKPQFEDTAYSDLNQVSLEAYFGKLPIVVNSIAYVRKIRDILPEKGKLDTSQKEEIKKLLKSWGNELTEHFNVSETHIALENIYNAYAYGMTVGNSKEFNAAKNNKIVEDANGYRFQNKDNMYLVITIGIPLLTDTKLTDETVAAILFHEIGHGFQQQTVQTLTKARMSTMYSSFVGTIKELVYQIASLHFINALYLICVLPIEIVTGFGLRKSRKNAIKDGINETDVALNKVNKKPNESFNIGVQESMWLFSVLVSLIQSLLMMIVSIIPLPGISSIAMTLIADPLYPIDLILRGAYFATGKKNEYFADAFAAKYGLGLDIAKFSYRAYELESESGINIPIITAIYQFNHMGMAYMIHAMDPHPTDRKRIRSVRDSIEKELLNNPDLPENMKKDMKAEITEIDALYNTLINPGENIKNGRQGQAIVYLLFGLFFKLKSGIKSAAELSAPIVMNKVGVAAAYMTTLKARPDLVAVTNVSIKDIETKLLNAKLLTEDEVLEYDFK